MNSDQLPAGENQNIKIKKFHQMKKKMKAAGIWQYSEEDTLGKYINFIH